MIKVDKDECDFCGACVAVCPVDCIELFEKDIEIDFKKCTECKLCIYVCPIEVMSY
ncbi:MAG: 4Fe-4S binding protein, partial [Candidatus Marinimicrobia bacterium]|nr:4Fe-4S binding protein [Candidatus Neomarinimicrobiota bacterium]